MRMRRVKAIGIIGGMGPAASEHFYGRLISLAQKKFGVKNNDDFPEIYLASLPVPDFISSEANQVAALEMILDRLQALDKLPITFYCMACNTGHLLLEEIMKKTEKPFVSLLEEVPRYAVKQGANRVGLLASPTTIRSQMYQNALAKEGIDMVIPDKADQEVIERVIRDTIAGINFEENSPVIQRVAKRLLNEGADSILEGCTEIPLVFPKQELVPVFDTLEILAEAVLRKYYLLE